MIGKNKKAQHTMTYYLITFILLAIVLIVAMKFLFKMELSDFFRNMPGFGRLLPGEAEEKEQQQKEDIIKECLARKSGCSKTIRLPLPKSNPAPFLGFIPNPKDFANLDDIVELKWDFTNSRAVLRALPNNDENWRYANIWFHKDWKGKNVIFVHEDMKKVDDGDIYKVWQILNAENIEKLAEMISKFPKAYSYQDILLSLCKDVREMECEVSGEFEVGECNIEVGSIFENRIYINYGGRNVPSEFYIKGSVDNGVIMLDKKEVADIEDGKIIVREEYRDYESEEFQEIRFREDVKILINQIKKMHEAEFFDYSISKKGIPLKNALCKEVEEAEFKPAWPENQGGEFINLEIKKVIVSVIAEGNFGFGTSKKKIYKIEIPYMEFSMPNQVEFLYVVPQDDYLQLTGFSKGVMWRDIGVIYPDDSIWFAQKEKLEFYGIGLNVPDFEYSEFPFLLLRRDYIDLRETNLRINYVELKKLIEK